MQQLANGTDLSYTDNDRGQRRFFSFLEPRIQNRPWRRSTGL